MPTIKDLIGIPFVDSGRDLRTGVDCWGLFVEVMKRYGKNIPDYKVMAFDTCKISSAMMSVLHLWDKVDNPEEGIAVSFAIDPEYPKVTQHFGVCIDKYSFIHTRTKTGSTIERLDNPFWSKKITGFWKWRE